MAAQNGRAQDQVVLAIVEQENTNGFFARIGSAVSHRLRLPKSPKVPKLTIES
jgi:hypothetical protein